LPEIFPTAPFGILKICELYNPRHAIERDTEVELVLEDVLEELPDRFESVNNFEQYGKFDQGVAPWKS